MLKKSTTMCSKEAEIKAIENLFNMNGYFAEYFSENEVEHMIQNIQNDLTFGMGVLVAVAKAGAEGLRDYLQV